MTPPESALRGIKKVKVQHRLRRACGRLDVGGYACPLAFVRAPVTVIGPSSATPLRCAPVHSGNDLQGFEWHARGTVIRAEAIPRAGLNAGNDPLPAAVLRGVALTGNSKRGRPAAVVDR